jgi:LuxR family transcriptional regulator, maltose regulon positive regulatory protein
MAKGARREPATRRERPASPMLRAKLRPPVVPEHHVRRLRLLQLVDDAVEAPVTLVVGPAGVGKTVLLSSWLAESTLATAWLSLDEPDRDARQLWSGLITALDTVRPGCGDAALTVLSRRGQPTAVVAHLLNDLDSGPDSPGVLVVDDLHVLDDDTAASLGLFLQHLPAWLHVVLLSRREPKLPIDRLQARGQLVEIRFAELRFSHEESREMLARLAPVLSEEEVEAAATHGAGWAAGLQLIALAARANRAHQPVEASPVGGDLLVDDYVWREVLAAEDEELIDALLDVSVADRLDPSLARALTGREDADRLLARAEARGLFVARIKPEGCFALHSLVRSVLLAELGRRSRTRLAEQHARAARWLQDAGEVPAALEHWLLADRPRDALRLLAARHAELYDRGREPTIRRTIAALPPGLGSADIESMVELAWCHLLVDRRRYLELVNQASWWADRSAVEDTLRARLTMLQSIAATLNGDWLEGGALARRAMQGLGDAWWSDPLGRFGWNMVARGWALNECWNDTGDDVREADLALSRDPERRLSFEGIRALGEALAGRSASALVVAAGVRRAAEVTNMAMLRAELALAEAVAHRELGDRERALPELAALADGPVDAMLHCRILATLELAHARLDGGDVAAARRDFERAESLIEAESFGRGGRAWLARAGTRLALAAGDLEDARRWADQVDDPFWGPVCAARVDLAAGDPEAGGAALGEVEPRCVRHEVVLGLLRARSIADHDESAKQAIAAVELASANGLLQSVASEGRDTVELVERAAWRVPAEWLDRLRRAAAEGSGRRHAGRTDLVEPLTPRERDVLRFLASRLTVSEIADELCLSVNTLKFHLKSMYRKLGVSSRAEASEAARRMAEVGPGASPPPTPSASDARTRLA